MDQTGPTQLYIKIVEVYSFRKVVFYSVLTTDDKNIWPASYESDFHIFVQQFSSDLTWKARFKTTTDFISFMGRETGIDLNSLRYEDKPGNIRYPLYAIPPNNYVLRESGANFEEVKQGDPDLRLYCMCILPKTVILFGGDVKTTDLAQHCKNVAPIRNRAIRYQNAITRAIDEDYILTHPSGKLLYEDDLTLELEL